MKHETHYGGQDNPYEAIKVIEAWGLGFNLGNVVKYLSRAGKKGGNSRDSDLKKALWYLDRELRNVELPEPSGELSLHGIEKLGWKEESSGTDKTGVFQMVYTKGKYTLAVNIGKDPFKIEEALLTNLPNFADLEVKNFEELNQIVK